MKHWLGEEGVRVWPGSAEGVQDWEVEDEDEREERGALKGGGL